MKYVAQPLTFSRTKPLITLSSHLAQMTKTSAMGELVILEGGREGGREGKRMNEKKGKRVTQSIK